MINNVNPSPINWQSTSATGKTSLSSEAQALLKDAFGFKGTKIVQVEKGMQVNGLTTLKEMSGPEATKLNQQIASALGIDQELQSVLVMVGGTELVKKRLKEMEKSLRKIDKKTVAKLAELLGISAGEDVLLFLEGQDVNEGGMIIIQAGLQEIKESI